MRHILLGKKGCPIVIVRFLGAPGAYRHDPSRHMGICLGVVHQQLQLIRMEAVVEFAERLFFADCRVLHPVLPD